MRKFIGTEFCRLCGMSDERFIEIAKIMTGALKIRQDTDDKPNHKYTSEENTIKILEGMVDVGLISRRELSLILYETAALAAHGFYNEVSLS